MSAIEAPIPVHRHERNSPGALLHLDIKKLGGIGREGHRIHGDRQSRARGVGWEFVRAAIDDHSRPAFGRVFSDQRHPSAISFLIAAIQYYQALGIEIKAILTDNGSCYRSRAFRQICTQPV